MKNLKKSRLCENEKLKKENEELKEKFESYAKDRYNWEVNHLYEMESHGWINGVATLCWSTL